MFEATYQWTMRRGPRFLLAAALILLFAGIWQFAGILTSDAFHFGTTEYFFSASIGPAVVLLFGAVLSERLGAR